jgi:hypothetical protein
MGIIYQVKIRCLKVKDVSKVDLTVVSEGDVREPHCSTAFKERLKTYIAASKENIESVLMVYDHDPGWKRDYTITNLYVPPDTNVLAFGNDACDRYGPDRYYDVKFYNFNKDLIEKKKVKAYSERNNFMLLVPPNTFFIKYVIGDYAMHSFEFGPKCYKCYGLDSSSDDSD